MSLNAATYLSHLRPYVNNEYVIHDGTPKEVVLEEPYFVENDAKERTRQVRLVLPGMGMAFKLDQDTFPSMTKTNGKKAKKPALFHFLDDTAMRWSRRCDFVVFYTNKRRLCADCIEFKSKSLNSHKIVPQLEAGVCWVRSLKHIVEHHTGDRQRIHLRKFVFSSNEDPRNYIDDNHQLNADPSIRFYHYDEVAGATIPELENASTQTL